MRERSFDEMIAYFNRRVADMDISQDCKMELVGMIGAIEYKHKTSVPQWIPCSERLPDTNRDVLLQFGNSMGVGFWEHNSWGINTGDDIYSEIGEREAQPIAWRELPEPWRGEKHETD